MTEQLDFPKIKPAAMVTHRSTALRFLAETSEVNFGGKVHGGAVMKWIDQAGYACAAGWSGHYCVTIYVGGIRFLHPIAIGHLVEVTAQVIHTGRTSMHIAVNVRAGDPKAGSMQDTTHCTIVFVAVSPSGDPVPVRAWVPETAEDTALEAYARRQMALRAEMERTLNAPHS